jgi:signal transduction histidine kinase
LGFINNIKSFEILLFGVVLVRKYIETFIENAHLNKQRIEQNEKNISLIRDAQIQQRKQIANLIHDNFGSRLAYLLHLLEMNKLDKVKENLHELSLEIRSVSHEIMPKSLSEGALLSALKTYISHLNTGLKDVEIGFSTYDFSEKLNQAWVIDMYLISMELINNSLKHGKPKHILLEFFEYEEDFCFQFSDDGFGFKSLNKGFGLNSICSRIENYGGEIDITSEENFGVIIQIRIPK